MDKLALIVLTGPSGAGKSSLVKEILSFYGSDKMSTIVSHTTRPLRPMEKQASDYHFVKEEEFLSLIKQGFFAEWAKVYNHYYGSSKKQIEEHWQAGRALIKDLDLQGAESVKKLYPQALRVFIKPPSQEELVKRVRKRQANSPEDMDIRFKQAETEIGQASQFEHQLKNEDFEQTLEELKKIIEDYLKTV